MYSKNIERTSMHFISRNYFPIHHWIEKNHNVIHVMAFALKGKVVIKEKLVLAVLYVIN